MKLKNKKTGEIVNAMEIDLYTDVVYLKISKDGKYESREYGSLAELNSEWEDYEESKHSYYLTAWGEVKEYSEEGFNIIHKLEIGNYFETKEEAEKAVEKLKAWKRLKDKGFSFNDWDWKYQNIGYNLDCTAISEEDVIEAEKDLDLLFGGEK